MFELKHHFYLESSRFLPGLPEGHPCRRMHGHSFKVTLKLKGELDPKLGWLMDFNDLKSIADVTLKKLDHIVLNEVEGLENPTSEVLARYIFESLKSKLPGLAKVTVSETLATECSYSPKS